MTAKLSNVDNRVLDFMRAAYIENGIPPSVREIADACGLASTSAVTHHLTTLVIAGFVRQAPGARGKYIPNGFKVVPDDDPLGHLRRVAERLHRIERENGIGERP